MKLGVFLIPLLASSVARAQELPDGKGKELVVQVCAACHGLDAVTATHASKQGWEDIVNYMVSRGAIAKDYEIKTIVEYLAKNFPSEPEKKEPPSQER